MSIKSKLAPRQWYGTIAEFNASPRIWKRGEFLTPTDSAEIRVGNSVEAFADLQPLPIGQAGLVAAHGNTTDLTAIGATFADLAAANSAVATLRAEAEARIAAAEAKTDAVITALKSAGLMASA